MTRAFHTASAKGGSDEDRLNANLDVAQGALNSGDKARVGRLAGFAGDDLKSEQSAKDTAAEATAEGAAVVASTAVVVGAGGTAAPLVVAGWATAAGGTAAAGSYALMEGDAASMADIASEGALGAVTAAREGAKHGAKAGAAQGAAYSATDAATRRETWDDGALTGPGRVGAGAVVGGASGLVLGGATGAVLNPGIEGVRRVKAHVTEPREVPVVENPNIEGRTTRVTYGEGGVTIEKGPLATAAEVEAYRRGAAEGSRDTAVRQT